MVKHRQAVNDYKSRSQELEELLQSADQETIVMWNNELDEANRTRLSDPGRMDILGPANACGSFQ